MILYSMSGHSHLPYQSLPRYCLQEGGFKSKSSAKYCYIYPLQEEYFSLNKLFNYVHWEPFS